ncbi:MAG: hypothetical protein ISS15_12660 [Alphaproteobacteria bacterium]|nr:hypothetical protein [Alphaproteobacteria bacterium]MBL6936448.1 hypothetical protein [Alphaproteobacteria bacterium]MBL7098501.1 hypothetical protein [Alphaproteobacteria bacterium]
MTGRSKVPDAALGVRSHSGWAAYVLLFGNPRQPDILARGRMQLCDPAITGSKQPFHEAEPMTFALAEKFIARCTASTAKQADKALAEIVRQARVTACCVLTASGRPLPDLKGILASHSTIHAAEGEFYRNAVAHACERAKIPVRRVRERDMEAETHNLPVPPGEAKARLAEFGKQVGAPWTADEKLSALGAWLMLASLPSTRSWR